MKLRPLAFPALLAVVFFCVRPLWADAAPDGPQEVGTMTVAAGATLSQVKNAIVSALKKRGWTVKSASDSTIVGYLKHRGYEATLTFHFDEKLIDIVSDSFEIDSDGKHVRRKNPTRWIKYLEQDIPRNLSAAMAGGEKRPFGA